MGYQVWLEGGGGAHGAGRKGGQVFPAEATVRRPTWEGSRRIGGTEPNPSFHDRRGPDATDGLQEGGRAGTTQTERIQMQLGFVLPIGSGAAPRWASGACPGLPVRGAGGGGVLLAGKPGSHAAPGALGPWNASTAFLWSLLGFLHPPIPKPAGPQSGARAGNRKRTSSAPIHLGRWAPGKRRGRRSVGEERGRFL